MVTRAVLAAAALAAGVIGLSGCGSQPEAPDPPAASVPPASEGPAGSWALAADQSASAAKAGLPMLGREMLAVHYHAHVDLLLRGERVAVPALVGIDTIHQTISPLHTHDLTGIVHIESGEDIPFTLGQFFTEWGQPLDTGHVGPVAVAKGEQMRVYHDGKQVSGDPAAIRFAKHGEYFIWIGPAGGAPSQIPSKYDFPKGL